MAFTSINPATEEVLGTFPEMDDAQVEAALTQAQLAHAHWRGVSIVERAEKLRALAQLLRDQKSDLARVITLEMGKPIVQAEAEIEKCAFCCSHFAEHGPSLLQDERIATSAAESYVSYAPLGVVLGIMPWNFPFWQAFRALVPALLTGNAFVLKHAANVPQCALAIERLVKEAGFPEGLCRTLLITSDRVSRVIDDPRVRLVTLTGSDQTGALVAATAGKAIKKTILELGGSDPFIVLHDADVALAATRAAVARNQNCGQSCIAAKRFLVSERIADEFEQRFVAATRALRVGNPLDRATDVGPLARDDLRTALEAQLQASVRLGAKVALGGARVEGRGYYFSPTVVCGVTPDMDLFRQETFGPVAAVTRVRDDAEAVRMANDSLYGLGASLWTQDLERARELATQLDVGQVFVNGIVASDPRLPFGGVKRSGYGRELSVHGLREMVNTKTIWIGPAS